MRLSCVWVRARDDAGNADRKLPAAETRGVACEQPPPTAEALSQIW